VEDLSAELDDESGFDWSALDEDLQQPDAEAAEEHGAGVVDTAVQLGTDDDGDVSETTETFDAPPPVATEPEVDPLGDVDTDLSGLAGAKRTLQVRSAVPLSLEEDAISIEVEGGSKTSLPYSRIDAMASAAVDGLADRPVIIVDLVLNWMSLPDEPLKVIRFRSDGFDPRRLVTDAGSALEALQVVLARLLEESGATPLPDVRSLQGPSFATFDGLAAYKETVLLCD
jgi:hypothetical protein